MTDVSAISHLFDEPNGNRNPDENESDVLASIQLEQNEKADIRDRKIILTKYIDDETEITYAYGQKIQVLPPLYQLKINDAISQNIPFKENAEEVMTNINNENTY